MSPSSPAGYRIEGPLGEGGFATVHRATQLKLKRAVALKILKPGVARSAEDVARFLQEARLTASLSHPNIVQAYDSGADGDMLWIAFELIEGPTLRELLRKGPLPLAEAVPAAAQVARALHEAHAHGVVHRDVKPHNVLRTAAGVCKLTDFGVARFTLAASPITQSASMIGSPGYMAPEVIQGEPATPAADVYGLGVVFYQLVTGELPFGGDPISVCRAHVSAPRPAPSAAAPGLPAAVDEVVAHAMAIDPAARFASAEAMAQALEAIGARPPPKRSRPSQRPVSGTSPPSTPPAPARRRPVVVAMVAVLAAAGLLAVRFASAPPAEAPAPPASWWKEDAVARWVRQPLRPDPAPLVAELLAEPARLSPELARVRPGAPLVAKLGEAGRARVREGAAARIRAWMAARGGDPAGLLASARRRLTDPACPREARLEAYDALAGLADVDGAGELVIGAPVLGAAAVRDAWVPIAWGARASAGGYRPIAHLTAPALRTWVASRALVMSTGAPVTGDIEDVELIAELHEASIVAMKAAMRAIELPEQRQAPFPSPWYDLGRLPDALDPSRGLTVHLTATNLQPFVSAWLRFGPIRSVVVGIPLAQVKPIVSINSDVRRAAIEAESVTATIRIPPGFLEPGDRAFSLAVRAFPLEAGARAALASHPVWVPDVVIESN